MDLIELTQSIIDAIFKNDRGSFYNKQLNSFLMKYRKIPTDNLGLTAYYLLQVTQGIFKWNGELFFCPFVTVEDKKHPYRATTWVSDFFDNRKYSLAHIQNETILLFADPVHPSTYRTTRQRMMDYGLGIDNKTTVFKKGNTLIIKDKLKTHRLEFVRKLSDFERRNIFDPNDGIESKLRHHIWITSKPFSSSHYNSVHRDEWINRYNKYRSTKNEIVPMVAHVA